MNSSDSESYDSDTRAPQVPRQAMGYNSYGRPSMTGTMGTPTSSQGFRQESSEEEEEEDDEEEDATNKEEKGSDEDDNDDELVATPIQPRGKTFRPPVGNGDSSSSSEDEGGYMQIDTNNTNINTPAINPSPGGPRGKELRLIARKDDNDDEPMKTRKKPKGATPKGATNSTTKKSPDKAPAKRSPSKAASSKKRKAPPSSDTDSDSDSDDSDDNACVATIVAGSDSEEVVTATIVKSSSSSKGDGGSAEKKPRGKPGPKKGSKRTKPSTSSLGRDMPEVSSEQAAAANESRLALQAAVDCLPYKVSDSHIIRSFGRIKPEYNASPLDALYSSPHSIYPVGFSCDRFEFSPVHGRVIRMRCDILDGSSLREYRDEMAKKKSGSVKVKSENGEEPALVDDEKMLITEKENVEDLGDGPVFRVTFGAGVDEDKMMEPSSPFDPYLASAHLGGDVDAIAVPLSSKNDKPFGYPEAGMRVSVRFDRCKMHGGTITSVKPMENKEKQRKKAICNISILYDDGVTEIAPFPDPDIIVAYQGCPPIETPDGHVTEMNGKSVRSVLAKSPIEAWGRTLLSLGLIDEVMYEAAIKSLDASRNQGFSEVREKMDAFNKKRRDDRAKEKIADGDVIKKDTDGASACDADNDCDQANAEQMEVVKEDYSTEEVDLRNKLAEMQKKLEATKKRSKAASFSLANVRISTISPFAANPFLCREESAAIEKTWFAAAVKKERALMGNTGNKRKIVTPSTMLDKSDAFFTQTIERLVEGLPGTEFAPLYVFHANRTSGSQAWVHEAKIRQLKQHQKRQSMDSKGSRQSNGNSKRDREREMKRKLFEATLADNKRLRQEQDDEKKRARVNKRLAQLNSQMDDRLFKEACMARERNVMNLARGMTKEFARRRKAIELIVCNAIERDAASSSSIDTSSTVLTKFGEMLPPVARIYAVEVVRIWDFLHSFSEVFSKSTELSTIPSLDILQDAFVCLKTNGSDKQKRLQAVDLFKGIALDLCKVISPSLTKMFSTSSNVIENIGKNGTEGGPQEDSDVSCLPVTELSWREIARMVFVYDVLTDLGYSKQDAANLVKGYRSGGHPNSREAKRWKKIEESPVVIFYQRLESHDEAAFRRRLVRARISTPCTPSSVPSPEDWQFYLHNIKSKSATSLQHMKDNVSKSLTALKLKSSGSTEAESYIKDLEKCLATLERSGNGNNMTPGSLELHKADLHKAKELVIGILDRTRETCFTPPLKSHEAATQSLINASEEPTRPLIGLHKMYQMSKEQFKLLEKEKEKYMVAALKLKEDLERKSADDGANDDEEDDEDDEDGKDNSREEDSDKMDVTESNISASRVNREKSSEAADTNITEEEKKSGAEYDADSGSHIPTEPEPAKKPRNKVGRPSKAVVAEEGEAAEAKVEYDFCEDIPTAPDLIRRCLAVIRALCATNSAEPFIYPVDPQLYPGYYENVMQPISLYDVGHFLLEAGHKFSSNHDDPALEEVVAEFGRKVRTIVQNSINNNASNNIVNSVEEMSRIFERTFFDWVLAPTKDRPGIEYLDDDMCVDHHESDVFSMVLVCDGCEAKYNMSRLKPALDHVPSGDWYCPRCATGRSWLTADPRIGRIVRKESFSGTVQSCKFFVTEDGKPSIVYRVMDTSSGRIEFWGVQDVDASILGDPVEPLLCLQALAECPGYGFGRDSGIIGGALPIPLNPLVGDKAAQAALSSGIFKDTVSACVSLTNQPEDLNADEWIQMLILLMTKCSQSDELQEISSKIEAKEHTRLASDLMTLWRCRGAKNVAASKLSDDDTDSSDDEVPPHKTGMPWEARSKMITDDVPLVHSPMIDTKKGQLPIMVESAAEIVTNDSGDQASSADDRRANVDISFNSSINTSIDGPDETKSAVDIPSYSIDAIFSEEDVLRKRRECSFLAKARREKKREDALVGFCIRKGLKSAAASFEEDFVQTIVKGALCNQEEGLDFSAVRCQETCHYCGLSDLALGAPLCRTPNRKEWREIFPLAVHKRTTYMIAEIPDSQNEEDVYLHPDAMTSISEVSSNSVVQRGTRAIAVRVRVGGELISSKSTSDDNAVKNFDMAMQQFLPHNPIGFQSELKFRGDFNLSILSGSLCAHEVCAVAAHRTLKDKYMNERIQLQRYNMSRIAAFSVGKTIPIGTDPFGRTYWVFNAEPNSLFVCQHSASDQKQWLKYEKPEEIASVLVCLGKHPLSDTLKETFPEAAKAMKDRSWSTLLMKRSLPHGPDAVEAHTLPDVSSQTTTDEQVDFGEPFVEDEDVLVESENGKFLWDAVIVDSSKDSNTGKVNGYLVHFKNWSSRFDRWVVPDRVVEPNKINMEVQEEVLQDFAIANDMTPPALKSMFAFQYLNAKKRARSTSATKTEIFECALPRQCASHREMLLGHLKSALLLIESALPRGSVGSSGNGSWTAESAALWRNFVKDAQGPESLMRCVLLLEDAINPDWLHSQATQLYACIPKQYRAMSEASLPSIALRVSILDRCLKYEKRKKKHKTDSP